MTLRELYDLAKQRQRAADRALAEADGRQACPAEIARLRFELDRATTTPPSTTSTDSRDGSTRGGRG